MVELQALPAVTVEVSHAGHNGVQTNRQTGVLLWTLLKAAEPLDKNGPRTHLQHTIRATGQDGYTVILAIDELEPDFEGKQVLVAYAEDRRAMATLKLIARILSCSPAGEHELVVVLGLRVEGTGARLLARATRQSWNRLALAAGQTVYAQVKGVALT